MSGYLYPVNGSGRCVNNATVCPDGVLCDARTGYCACPLYFDPLDGCQTSFFTARPMFTFWFGAASLLIFAVAFVLGLAPLVHEISMLRQRKRSWPKPMLVQAAAFVVMAAIGVVYALLFMLGAALPFSIVFSTGWSLVALVYHVVSFAIGRIFLKAHALGSLPRRWRMVTVVTAVVGIVATLVQYIIALTHEVTSPSRLLQTIALTCIGIGFGATTIVYIVISAWALAWFRQQVPSPVIAAISKTILIKFGLDAVVIIVLAWSLANAWMEPLMFDTIEMAEIRSVCIAAAFCAAALGFGWSAMVETRRRRRQRELSRRTGPPGSGVTPAVTGSTASTISTGATSNTS
jgi:hypothetical protein